ncbi:hypothetical protein CTI12_AA090780 [Artemisia annua]|uniref:Nucleic acid-binding, OB-fold protein n=1 Tax=Artemisia annua TaxID=35608 RepID=A0A2U1PRU2_ARTAN|nr:hypothetical protein CTI12_AA090780 [Artemisia annua]
MHSLQVNFDRPFGDVSGLERQRSIQDEVPSVSRCHERTLYVDNDAMLVECDPCGSSRGVVNNHNCHTGFGKGKATYNRGTATGNPTHGFRIYENTLFQPEGSIPCNSDPSCLDYTEIAHAYSVGPATTDPFCVYQTYGNMVFESGGSHLPNIQGAYLPQQPEATLHPLTSKGRPCKRKPGIPLQGIMFKGKRRRGSGTDQEQQNVVDGKRNSHYTDQMRYLYSDEPSVDLHSPASTHVSSAAEGIYYSPTPLPMNEPLSHSGNGQENAEAAPASTSILQHQLRGPTIVTSVSNPSAYSGEDRHRRFQARPVRQQGRSTRRGSDCGSTTAVNGEAAPASTSILQHHLRDPTIVTSVSNPSAYSGEDRHRKFQARPVRQQGRSTRRGSHCGSTTAVNGGDLTPAYLDIGDADWRCQWCGTSFWFGERLKSSRGSTIRYSRCCGEGNVRLQQERDPPDSIKLLFKDKHFMENIRAYNQMFNLTPAYLDIGDADWRCQWCGASFWFGERLKSSRGSTIRYSRCCGEGNVRLQQERDPPDSIKQLFKDKHFMENIRAYNQMFIEQLIQILDTHNELVALFRTARDICNENDVPDFTVRLYNVDGARQYDLPSADILGAIVFESGPETDTEYDVVIHKKGERPQRINKLHSTYMALQFPLLFVYGQPGRMALVSATLSCIRDLTPGDTGKILELKVYRVWASRNPPDTTETGYRAILLDRHGDAIQANMDADDIHHFKPLLITGKAIRVSDFECTPTDKWQRTLENPTSLSFKKLTRIDEIPADSFPNHYFHFTSYNQLPTKVWDPRDKGIKDYPILTGSSAHILLLPCEAGNVGNPTTNQSRLRKVEIQNLKYRLNDTEQEQQKNRIPFQELYKHKAASYKGVRFTCEATITKVNTSRGWYYTSCCVCISKVTYEDGNYKCKTHGVIPAPNYRATLTDGATSATFIFFTPKADDFLGINCGDLVASNKNSQQSHFPNEIQAIVGTTHTFQFHYNTTSNPGVTEFVVDEVFGITDKPKEIASDMPKALPAPTAELKGETTTNTTDHNDSSKDITQLAKLQNVEPEGDKAMLKKEQKTPCKEEQGNLPQAETNQVLKKEEETACKEEQHSLPQAETKQDTTPPQAASLTIQTRSKTEVEPNVGTKTVKRRIFTEDPSENKKKRN